MKRILHFLFPLLVISACTLNSEQELRLTKDLGQYINIRNQGDVLSFVNSTHPIVVKHYKELGDSVFFKTFNEIRKTSTYESKNDSLIHWRSGIIKATKAKDTLFQARIEIALEKNYSLIDSSVVVYATSSKNSPKWLFVNAHEYFKILPKELQLFD